MLKYFHFKANIMTEIYCNKLQKTLPSLNKAPFPGPLGERIFQQISQEAWKMWLTHQTMLINEYRLNLLDPDARSFLNTEMEKFLFGEGSTTPAGFTKI